MSNPVLDVRMRCDLVGMLSLTSNWKGWEVWRFIETGGVQGQIRINSWMHSQRYLTSNANGKVTTIAASTLDRYKQQQQQQNINDDDDDHINQVAVDESLWTVEAAPNKQGCILRSVAYSHRILACRKVVVVNNSTNNNNNNNSTKNDPPDLQLQQTHEDAVASSLPCPDETISNHHHHYHHGRSTSASYLSFSRSIASFREQRTTRPPTETLTLFTEDELVLQKEHQQQQQQNESTVDDDDKPSSSSSSFVWHLEAAHSQRYSLSTTTEVSPTTTTATTNTTTNWSVGPGTAVTKNRRQIEAIRLEQYYHAGDSSSSSSSSSRGNDDNTVTLFLETQQQYLGTSASDDNDDDGIVTLSPTVGGESEQWLMKLGKSGGYTFQSKLNGGFLSFREEEIIVSESASNSTAAAAAAEEEDDNGQKKWSIAKLQKMAKQYSKKETVQGVLCTKRTESFEEDYDDGTDYRPTHLWRLDPILPRAVSSSKIKTFAIGTSIAVGTTIAMPFACAGIIGLMGTEMGILANIVTVGLTSAEAIASVGVIGTTAALVFREDGDSLAIVSDGDAVASDDESRHRHEAFLKRPFCNWRVW